MLLGRAQVCRGGRGRVGVEPVKVCGTVLEPGEREVRPRTPVRRRSRTRWQEVHRVGPEGETCVEFASAVTKVFRADNRVVLTYVPNDAGTDDEGSDELGEGSDEEAA